MDERVELRDMLINFTNDQKSAKTKILIQFEELEEKPSELTFTVPNPFVSRFEIIKMLNARIIQINTAIEDLKSLEKRPITKKKGFPVKEKENDEDNPFE